MPRNKVFFEQSFLHEKGKDFWKIYSVQMWTHQLTKLIAQALLVLTNV